MYAVYFFHIQQTGFLQFLSILRKRHKLTVIADTFDDDDVDNW